MTISAQASSFAEKDQLRFSRITALCGRGDTLNPSFLRVSSFEVLSVQFRCHSCRFCLARIENFSKIPTQDLVFLPSPFDYRNNG